MNPGILARADELVRSVMASRHVLGLSIALVAGSDIVWSAAYGTADVETGEPLTVRHRFSAMSVTKPVIATALLQLHERGLFALDDPANEYLEGAINNEFESESPVTIRQLFTHTSGLPQDVPPPPGTRPLAEHLRLLARTTRRPGETIVYANWGYDAMGLLIERLSGEALDVYVRKNVLEPLGMASSFLGNPPQGAPVARGHVFSAVDERHHRLELFEWPVTPASPAGGLFSTAEDLARFLIALVGGGGALRPETAAEMQRVHAPDGGPDSGMGLGWRVTRANGRRLICHGGDGAGYTAFAGAYPEEKLGVVLLMNTGGAQGARSMIANGVLALAAGELPQVAPARTDIRPFGGRYRSSFWDIVADISHDSEGPTATIGIGFVNPYREEMSRLAPGSDGALTGRGGMFNGFQLTFLEDEAGVRFAGGVYPWVFTRESDTVPVAEPTDERAVLAGAWQGTVQTLIGALAVTLRIGGAAATVSTPFGQDIAVEAFRAERGLVEGEFSTDVPGFGATRMFLRLRALSGGRLAGLVFARVPSGEAAMPLELSRE